jgi:hypothetical protein
MEMWNWQWQSEELKTRLAKYQDNNLGTNDCSVCINLSSQGAYVLTVRRNHCYYHLFSRYQNC